MRALSIRCIGVLLWATTLLGYNVQVAPAAHLGVPGPGGDRFVPHEIVVELTSRTALATVAARYHLDPTPLDHFGSRPIYRLHILDASDPQHLARTLLRDHLVIYAEPNVESQAPESRQSYSWAVGGSVGSYTTQWAPTTLHIPAAQRIATGRGVTVAVLDTGVDLTHPLLAGRLVKGYDFVNMDSNPQEVGARGVDRGFGHGTHVSGLIALVAPDAKIMPLRVLDSQGVGNVWVLAEALAYAVDPDGNPATPDGASIINLSLSMPRESRLLRDVLRSITCSGDTPQPIVAVRCAQPGHGVVVVMAAGNNASRQPEYPAGDSIGGAISVGASTKSDTIASFSNRGSWVKVLAPGDRIMSSVPGGGYGTWSGTSMAAPLASGVAALVRSQDPTLAPDAVVARLVTTATRIGGDVHYRLDAAAAVSQTGRGKGHHGHESGADTQLAGAVTPRPGASGPALASPSPAANSTVDHHGSHGGPSGETDAPAGTTAVSGTPSPDDGLRHGSAGGRGPSAPATPTMAATSGTSATATADDAHGASSATPTVLVAPAEPAATSTISAPAATVRATATTTVTPDGSHGGGSGQSPTPAATGTATGHHDS